ncbi:Chitinase 1, partial [Termitomyces sp. T112]
KGKIVTLSLGGATGAASFSSDAQAQDFADTIWNLFLGGSSSTRPFGAAVLDGVDLDIEGGGTTYYASFISRIRSHASGAIKQYYVTAAPQCVYPDAYLGTVLNAAAFDAVYVQYNNFCGLQNYNNANAWDFGLWDNWAKTVAVNKNVKVYIGAPASSTAAGSGYVDAATLGSIAKATRATYSSFGGIMLWDASQAYANGRFDSAVKSAMGAGTGSNPSTTTQATTTLSTTKFTTTTKSTTATSISPSATTTVGTGNCASVAAWASNVAYVGGQQVTYNGHLWTAQWWTYGDTPGGSAGVWTDNGACNLKLVATSAISASASAGHHTTATHSVAFVKAVSPASIVSSKASVGARTTLSQSTTSHSAASASSLGVHSSRFFRF